MLLGGNVHLDITWINRLVGSLIRGSVRYRPRWSLRPGTVASCLHGWLIDRGWRLVREWVWEYDFAAVCLDLFPPRVLPSLLSGLAGVAHNLRQGWRAWCFQKWANSGRHEVQQLEEATSAIFRSLNFQDIRDISGLGLVQWYSCHYCLGCDLLTGQFSGARACEIYLSLARL